MTWSSSLDYLGLEDLTAVQMSLCAGTSNVDLAGDLVQSLENYLGLEDLTADVSVCRDQ